MEKAVGTAASFSILHNPDLVDTTENQICIHKSRTGQIDLSALKIKLKPLARKDYEYFSQYQEGVLLMFDRQDPKKILSTDMRIELYWKLVQFWNSLFLDKSPQYLISRNVPHFPSEYILYLTFMRYQKPFFMLDYCEHIKRMLLISDLNNRYLQNFPEIYDRSDKQIDTIVSNITDKHYQGVNSVYKNIYNIKEESFTYRIKVRIRLLAFSLKNAFKRVNYSMHFSKNLTKLPYRYQVGFEFFKNTFILQSLFRYYRKMSYVNLEAIEGKKLILLALHYQPERTSLPDSIPYHNQLRVVDALSRSLQKDWVILVKEHPTIFRFPYKVFLRGNYSRSKSFYDQILSYSNTYLIPIQDSSQYWIRKVDAIATLTGSITLESLCLNKKVVLFGKNWYQSFSNTHIFQNEVDLVKFLSQSSLTKEENLDKVKSVLAYYNKETLPLIYFNKLDPNEIKHECKILVKAIEDHLNTNSNA